MGFVVQFEPVKLRVIRGSFFIFFLCGLCDSAVNKVFCQEP